MNRGKAKKHIPAMALLCCVLLVLSVIFIPGCTDKKNGGNNDPSGNPTSMPGTADTPKGAVKFDHSLDGYTPKKDH